MTPSTKIVIKREILGPYYSSKTAQEELDLHEKLRLERIANLKREALDQGRACSLSPTQSSITKIEPTGKLYVVIGEVTEGNMQDNYANKPLPLPPPSLLAPTPPPPIRPSKPNVPHSGDQKVGGRKWKFEDSTDKKTTIIGEYAERSVMVQEKGAIIAEGEAFDGEVIINQNPNPLPKCTLLPMLYRNGATICKKIYSVVCSIRSFIYRMFQWLGMQLKRAFC